MQTPDEQAHDTEKDEMEAVLARGIERAAEALIFAADDPVTPARIAEVFSEVTGEEPPDEADVYRAIDRLNKAYEETDRTFRIERWAGGLRMATEPSLGPYLKSFFRGERHTRLSRSLMETLAVVAYRQPVTKPEVDFVRGVDSDYGVRKLLELGLVDVVGRSESLGRPLLYGTTELFLEQFGLADLEDLPTLREIEQILDDPAFDQEKARLLELDEEARLDLARAVEPDGASDGASDGTVDGKPEGDDGHEKSSEQDHP